LVGAYVDDPDSLGAACDSVQDGVQPKPELFVCEVGWRDVRVLRHGRDQAGKVFGVG
jgi:hypothetical protein